MSLLILISLVFLSFFFMFLFFFLEERDIKGEGKDILTLIFNKGGSPETNEVNLKWTK